MRISDTTRLTFGEKMAQAVESEYRKNEQALAQVSGTDVGLGKEEKAADTSQSNVAEGTDVLQLSSLAISRYRAVAGDSISDRKSFTRQNYEQTENLKKQLVANRAAGKNGSGEGDSAEAAENEGRQVSLRGTQSSLSVRGVFSAAYGMMEGDDEEAGASASVATGPGEAGRGAAPRGGGGSSDDPVQTLQERIREVQQLLSAAQARMSEATAKVQESVTSGTIAPEGNGDAEDLTAALLGNTQQLSAMQGQAMEAQAELAASETEVNALAAELVSLYQQLMKLLNNKEQG